MQEDIIASFNNHGSEPCGRGNREGAVGRKRKASSGTYQSIKLNVLTISDIIKVDTAAKIIRKFAFPVALLPARMSSNIGS